LQQFAF